MVHSAEVVETGERMNPNGRGTRGQLRCVGSVAAAVVMLLAGCSSGTPKGRNPDASINHHGVAENGLDDHKSCREYDCAADGIVASTSTVRVRTTNAACEYTTIEAAGGKSSTTSRASSPSRCKP